MRIRYRQSGGFAGVCRACSLDTDDLPAPEAQELERVARAAVEAAFPPRPPAKQARDLTCHELHVDDGKRSLHATFDDLSTPREAQPLLDLLQARARPEPLDR
jgi:hypothetical protein